MLRDDTRKQLRAIGAELAADTAARRPARDPGARATNPGLVVVFSGPPSPDKRLAAELLGSQLDQPVRRIDLSQVVSKYIGETEKNLRSVFDTAETAGEILFFDEADALFGKRTAGDDRGDRYTKPEAGYLLERVAEYPGLVILATDSGVKIDRVRMRFVGFPEPA